MREVFINVADFDIWCLSKGEQEWGGGGDFLGGLGHK